MKQHEINILARENKLLSDELKEARGHLKALNEGANSLLSKKVHDHEDFILWVSMVTDV